SHAAGSAAAAPQAPAAAVPLRAAAAVRVLSVQAGTDDVGEAEERRSRTVWILLAVALLGAGAFHGWRWWTREQAIAELRTLPGAPDGMMLLPSAPGTPKTLIPVKGPPDRTQVEKFKAQQSLVGNEVTELQGGGLVVAPRPEPRPEVERRSP
ncbi:MAG TPA: hypothetical protein VFP50_04140, partial [Anaeromyxobacteraceae bacterium]|nr:hypothetical protein [Anaeromyxobacteraceae bacterium]